MQHIDINSPNPWVEVRKSDKHGMGVFAKRDIPRGTVVCYYDGHDIKTYQQKDYPWAYALTHPSDKGITRIGFEHPKNQWGIGQLANDYMFPTVRMDDSEILSNEQERCCSLFQAYGMISLLESTLTIINDQFEMATARKVKKDEELTFYYGSRYWIHYYLAHTTNALRRFILYAMLLDDDIEDINDDQAKLIMQNVICVPNESDLWLSMDIDKNLSIKEKIQKLAKKLNII